MTRSQSRRPTAADVAREAGVSAATVSFVLNDTPHQKIPEATRQRVLDAAKALGYAPSALARALASGRSDIVLCLMPDWPLGPDLGAFLEQTAAALERHGLTFVSHPRAHSTRPLSDIWKNVTPAAVLALEDVSKEESDTMRAAGIKATVAVFSTSKRRRGGLEIPEQRIGRLQAEHLAAIGHARIGYAFPTDPRLHIFAQPRLEGVEQACADLGLDEPVVQHVDLTATSAASAIHAWRTESPPVTGVCAYNDETAFALLAGLRQDNLTAPHNLAVMGVDDLPTAGLADPPLTTIRRDWVTIGQHTAETIVRKISGKPAPPQPQSYDNTVIRRESA